MRTYGMKDLLGDEPYKPKEAPGAARSTDPATSWIAAKLPGKDSLRGRVYAQLKGSPPKTQWEVSWALGLTKQKISPRFVELERKGLIERCGEAYRRNDEGTITKQELWRECLRS